MNCPHCQVPVTATDHPRPILLNADGGPHVATCVGRVRVARVVPLGARHPLDGAAIAKALVDAVSGGRKGRGK